MQRLYGHHRRNTRQVSLQGRFGDYNTVLLPNNDWEGVIFMRNNEKRKVNVAAIVWGGVALVIMVMMWVTMF